MKTSRRNFLRTGTSAIALSAGILSLPNTAKAYVADTTRNTSDALAVPNADAYDAIASLNSIDFEKQIGTYFRFISPSLGESGGELVEVRDVLQGGSLKDRIYHTQGFSLLFRPARSERVFQDVFLVEHETLGSFYMLLSPVRFSRKDRSMCFEAVVNRFI